MTPSIRPAVAADAEAAAAVICASITALCEADHHGDAAVLARWCGANTPEALAGRIAEGRVFVAAHLAEVVAVGAIELAGLEAGQGKISANYVAPGWRFRGLSRAMLARLEAELAARGCREGVLTATATAIRFYLARGWWLDGPARQGRWIVGQPMRKALRAAAV